MPAPLAAERLHEFANLLTCYHRKVMANLLPLSNNPKNQPYLVHDDLGAPSLPQFHRGKGGRGRTPTTPFPFPDNPPKSKAVGQSRVGHAGSGRPGIHPRQHGIIRARGFNP